MSNKRNYTNLPNKEIVNYWAQRIDECELNVDQSDAHDHCWGCGDNCKLQHCHIIPHALGGPYEPSNIVLLCNQCHKENPNTTNPDLYWTWLKSRRNPVSCGLYGTYWGYRDLIEYNTIYKSDLIKDILEVIPIDNIEVFLQDFRTFISGKFVNDGNRHSPSTIATLLREYILKFKNSSKIGQRIDNIIRFEGQGPVLEILS